MWGEGGGGGGRGGGGGDSWNLLTVYFSYFPVPYFSFVRFLEPVHGIFSVFS